MVRKSIGLFLVVMVGLLLIGCGGEPREAGKTTSEVMAEKLAEKPAKPDVGYYSEDDPDAVYTIDDVEMTGSYLRVDFRGLTDKQVNRVVHRLRTELSTCNSGLTIDECMVNRPQCSTAVHLAKQVIREEKMKS